MNTVLVVDNSRTTEAIVKQAFSELSIPCQFLRAENDETALEALEGNKISIVFLDWDMSAVNGLLFLKKVTVMPTYGDLPVIVVASETAKYNMVEALQNGAIDYIIKPISKKELKIKISDILL